MGRKRLTDMSYTSEPEGLVHPTNYNHNSNSGLKFLHKSGSGGGGGGGDGDEDEQEDDRKYNHKTITEDEETEGPDTWSIRHGPPSTLDDDDTSAKFTTKNYNNNRNHLHHPKHQHDNHHKWKNKSKQNQDGSTDTGDGSTTVDNDTTDEEFHQNCVANMSSASSSISWAEDAVESELTQKIFGLWEDIQRVATGEVGDRPTDMSVPVFEECLKWKRAFPVQNLERFSRYSEDALTPTEDRLNLSLQSVLNYKSSSPDNLESPNNPESCMTPNPEKNSHYVALWLSDCQNQVPPPILQLPNLEQDLKSMSITNHHSQDTRCSSPSTPRLPSASVTPTHNNNNMSLLHSEPDPNNFFTSLALNNIELTPTNPKTTGSMIPLLDQRFSSGNYKSRKKSEQISSRPQRASSSTLRVQRPISSHVKGHLITPLPTKFTSRSFRETSKGGRGNVFDDHEEEDEEEEEEEDLSTLSNDSDISTFNFGPIPNRLTIPKGKTAPVFPVCHPPMTPAHCRSSYGPRRPSRAGYTHNNSVGSSDINPNYGQFSNYGSGGMLNYGKRKEQHSGVNNGGRHTATTSTNTMDNNGYMNGGGGGGVYLPQIGPAWSRHSSISETFSFKVSSFDGGGGGGGGESMTTTTTTTSKQEGHYFESVCQNFEPQTRRGLSRPHFLPLRCKETDNIQPPKAKPGTTRPFLYWLLDKVSPS